MWIKVPTSQMMDTEDTQNVTELALALAKNAIAAAIKSMEGSNPLGVRKGWSHYITAHQEATNKLIPCLQKPKTPSKISTGSHRVNSQKKGAVNKLRSSFR